MKKSALLFVVAVFMIGLIGCGSGDEAVSTESAANAAAAQDPTAANAERAGDAGSTGGNKGTGGMPEGAGRPPISEGGDLARPGGG